ncbi:hypothetical protein L9F63_004765, partial [Diploptera punctata]
VSSLEGSPKNSIISEINQSEAGPEIADDGNVQGGDVFKDPSTFDFLNSIGNSNIVNDLRKESLYVKFDPLVGGMRTTDPSVLTIMHINRHNNIDPSIITSPESLSNNVTPPRNVAISLVDRLISLSPSPRKQQVEPPVKQVITPVSTPVKESSTCEEQRRTCVACMGMIVWTVAMSPEELYLLREILAKQDEKYREDIFVQQQKFEHLQAKLKEYEEREARLNKKVAEKAQGQKQMSIIMEEYEKTISRLVAEKEQERQAHEIDRASLVKERDTAMGHLANIEIAFSDLHKKYERSKTVIEGFKKNEEVLRASLADYEATIQLEWFNVSQPLSLKKELLGKVVVLDFFTYCCINCLHILPMLKQVENEYSIEDGLVVVGVHSAKFDNEKDSANILSAIQRYNITHPVVNDAEGTMWHELAIPCWPTLIILGPSGEVLFLLVGESHKKDVLMYIKCTMKYFSIKEKLQNHSLPISPANHVRAPGALLFPGKVACIIAPANSNDIISVNNNSSENLMQRLAVSDTGHHRITVFTTSGKVEYVIGGDEPGFSDGSFKDARFRSPQGIEFRTADILYVADTENHALREINLKTLEVCTLFKQENCSPWDLCIASSKLLKDSLTLQDVDKDVLIIAMAGFHQIWAYFFNTVSWWKGKVYEAGTCTSIAGTGKEENRNNFYPHAAGFAQPSGLTLAPEHQALYIADSESSSIRKLSLIDGKVSAVAGGSKSPFNLFTFGDKDGVQFEARLQHPLGVAWNSHDQTLYVADSYNHKLKTVDCHTNNCKTLVGGGSPGNFNEVQLNEPGGLCVSTDGTQLYIADTNNHCLKVVSLKLNTVDKLAILLPSDQRETSTKNRMLGTVLPTEVKINSTGGEINLLVSVTMKDGIELTAGAPQKWILDFPDGMWSTSSSGGEYTPAMSLRILAPKANGGVQTSLSLNYRLYTCVKHSECSMNIFSFLINVLYSDDAPAVVHHKLSHMVTM